MDKHFKFQYQAWCVIRVIRLNIQYHAQSILIEIFKYIWILLHRKNESTRKVQVYHSWVTLERWGRPSGSWDNPQTAQFNYYFVFGDSMFSRLKKENRSWKEPTCVEVVVISCFSGFCCIRWKLAWNLDAKINSGRSRETKPRDGSRLQISESKFSLNIFKFTSTFIQLK